MTEEARTRGKLKLFLGYADGVGKTYSMLQAAHQRQNEGSRVVVAWIEPGRLSEAESLLQGLEVILPHPITGASGGEMDVDTILARRPALVVVDDLAETNPPGARHPRRYLSLIHISEPPRLGMISYAVF